MALPSPISDNDRAHRLTLRDPDGILLKTEDGRFLRFVSAGSAALIERAIRDEAFLKKTKLVPSSLVEGREATLLWRRYQALLPMEKSEGSLVLEHAPVFFQSYAYEWCSDALVRAANLTLDIAEETLRRGWGLKDATPYNILFEGPKPVFVDWLSLEVRSPSDPTWLAFSQFLRCFVMPLWMEKHSSLPLQAAFLAHRDGITPERAYELVRTWRRFTPSFFTLVTLPVLLNRRKTARAAQTALYAKSDIPPDRAKFVLKRLYGFLREQLSRVSISTQGWTQWNGYLDSRSPYEREQWELKRGTLEKWLAKAQPRTLLDIGCNEGWFSLLAAQGGARVVAIDNDREMVRRTWRKAEKHSADIQALHLDISRPSPAIGWRNEENPSFLERCAEKFDAVAALAVIHHLAVGEQISYEQFFSMIHRMAKMHFFVEFVGPSDDSFQWAAKGRNSDSWSQAAFLKALQSRFQIVEEKPIPNSDRTLYWLQGRFP